MLCDGHTYLIALPGLAKTILIRTLAVVSGCQFNRIQFTVDLLPTDITGLTTFDRERNVFTVVKGPVFSNFVIADEINRAPPKTQSALLEAMQEMLVTIGRDTFKLRPPFFVMATQNPIESAGTYPLPEAQIDRFLFNVGMSYPSEGEEKSILHQNISLKKFEEFKIQPVLNAELILKMQELVKHIHTSDSIEKYIVRITNATRYPDKFGLKLGHYIEYGGSPRASIGLFIGAKAQAFMQGMSYVTPQHVKDVAFDVLRHRILLTYEAQAENLTSDEIIAEILARVPVP
ncbi:MoxR family ATPase [Candidatus Woesearchaeota archaeon]|nr:MoxR family ATPase [Candidatus Woesearchaeota archaeon]